MKSLVEQREFGLRLMPPEPCTPDPGASGAVSYTHLRAHETVLDLVCRLLLEKKKQLKKKTNKQKKKEKLELDFTGYQETKQ